LQYDEDGWDGQGRRRSRMLEPAGMPPEAGILPEARAGDSDREMYITHLGNMHADGHIDAGQYSF
jgi:hypothetical protein